MGREPEKKKDTRQRTRFLYAGSEEKPKESDVGHFALVDGRVLMKASFDSCGFFGGICVILFFSLLCIETF